MRYLFGFLCLCALGAVPLVGCSDTQPECETGSDCSDDNECTNDVCDSASRTCSNTPVANGTDCTFNRVAGVCVSGVCGLNLCQGVVCEDDGNECTEDVCNFVDGTCYAPVGDGTECSEGACLDAACTTLTTVEGVVTLYQSYTQHGPAENATVRVRGTSLNTTTDSRGWFSIDVFEGDWFFESSKDGLWGWIQLAQVPYPGSALDLLLASDTLIGQIADELDIEIDAAKAIAVLDFNESSGQGGETATLSAPYGHVSAQDADQKEVLSDELLPGGGSELWYYNVDPTEELSVTPAGADGVHICELQFPEAVYPVVGKVITFVDVLCKPTP